MNWLGKILAWVGIKRDVVEPTLEQAKRCKICDEPLTALVRYEGDALECLCSLNEHYYRLDDTTPVEIFRWSSKDQAYALLIGEEADWIRCDRTRVAKLMHQSQPYPASYDWRLTIPLADLPPFDPKHPDKLIEQIDLLRTIS